MYSELPFFLVWRTVIYTPLVSRYDGAANSAGLAWTGVARIHDRRVSGSAVLLASGLHLLTVGHLVDDFDFAAGEVVFEAADGMFTREILSVEAYPEFLVNSSGVWHDLALVTLTQAAPASAERYALYSGTNETGNIATLVGYGQAQDIHGAMLTETQATRKAGANIIDAAGTSLVRAGLQGSLSGQLFFDYDDGTTGHDTLGSLLGTLQLCHPQ